MPIGIIAGLTTCALWGLTFVAPRAVAPFTALDLTIARYGIFGVVSACLMVHGRFRPSGFGKRRIALGLLLGGCGYVGYFVSVAEAVRLAGPILPPIVVGTMPVVLALLSNRGVDRVPWSILAPAIAAITCGVAVVDLDVLASAGSGKAPDIVLGSLDAGLALLIWVAYGAVNGAVMRTQDPPDALRWTGLQGIGAALGSVALLPFSGHDPVGTSATDLRGFVVWASIMGVAASWLATLCWAVASRRLPTVVAAQLIVAETLFGSVFGLAFERRWPSIAEVVGFTLQVAGVVIAITELGRYRSTVTSQGPFGTPLGSRRRS